MNITFPDDTPEIINAIRTAIGRNITFYSKVQEDCPACVLDPVTNTSTNSFCTVCSGVGYVVTFSGYTVLAHITHSPADIMQWNPGGQVVQGDCRVQIEYTVANEAAVDSANYVIVDNKKFQVKKKILRGFKLLNRILVDLIERNP